MEISQYTKANYQIFSYNVIPEHITGLMHHNDLLMVVQDEDRRQNNLAKWLYC